jgi:hypothetical protein
MRQAAQGGAVHVQFTLVLAPFFANGTEAPRQTVARRLHLGRRPVNFYVSGVEALPKTGEELRRACVPR